MKVFTLKSGREPASVRPDASNLMNGRSWWYSLGRAADELTGPSLNW